MIFLKNKLISRFITPTPDPVYTVSKFISYSASSPWGQKVQEYRYKLDKGTVAKILTGPGLLEFIFLAFDVVSALRPTALLDPIRQRPRGNVSSSIRILSIPITNWETKLF